VIRFAHRRETLCVFIFKCIHLGDVERYYGKMIVRLLPCIFSCLEVEESGEEGGEGEENVKDEGVREGMSMTRQTIATLATGEIGRGAKRRADNVGIRNESRTVLYFCTRRASSTIVTVILVS